MSGIIGWTEDMIAEIEEYDHPFDLKYCLKNPLTFENFAENYEIENIEYFKYYGDKTLVFVQDLPYVINMDYIEVLKKLNTLTHQKNKKVSFIKVVDNKIAINVNKVININKNVIELKRASIPVRKAFSGRDGMFESFKNCITYMK